MQTHDRRHNRWYSRSRARALQHDDGDDDRNRFRRARDSIAGAVEHPEGYRRSGIAQSQRKEPTENRSADAQPQHTSAGRRRRAAGDPPHETKCSTNEGIQRYGIHLKTSMSEFPMNSQWAAVTPGSIWLLARV